MTLVDALLPQDAYPGDPLPLPSRRTSQLDGLDPVIRGEVLELVPGGVRLRIHQESGTELDATIAIVAPGVARVLMHDPNDPPERTRLARPPATPPEIIRRSYGDHVEIESAHLTIDVGLQPFRMVARLPSGRVILAQSDGDLDAVERPRALRFGVTSIDGRRVAFHDAFELAPDEHFYGFGEKFTGVDKRGQSLDMWNYDALGVGSERAYKNVPFFLSTRGYGIFVDSVRRVAFDMGRRNNGTVDIAVPDTVLDYYVIAGPDPKAIINRYGGLVGYPVVPPKWALGLWVSTDWATDLTSDGIRERVRLLSENGIPVDVIHIDSPWQRFGCWSDLEWDRQRLPDAEALLAELVGMGLKPCLWINPYIGVESPVFEEAAEAGYLLATPAGGPYVADLWGGYHPPVGILDFTNGTAVDWYQGRLRSLLELGVQAFKTDFAERIPADAIAANGMTGEELHNLYPLLFNDAVSDITSAVTGREGFTWGRSTYAGGQRHAIQWAGDPNSTYVDLASVLRGGLSIGLSGHAFWSHDIGGFHGVPTPDLYVRWAQFGLLSPCSRAHGNSSRVPWAYGKRATEIFREFAELRYRLLPYLYSIALEAGETSLPILRHMLLEFPDDPSVYGLDLQYMLGPDLLVAPIFNPEGRRTVYLPAGRWIDFWTRQVTYGPRHLEVIVPLERIPLFVRGDALIATAPVAWPLPLHDEPFPVLVIDAYLFESGRLVLRDVKGTTLIAATRTGRGIALAASGSMRSLRVRVLNLDGLPPVQEVTLNGVPLTQVTGGDAAAPGSWSIGAGGDAEIVVHR